MKTRTQESERLGSSLGQDLFLLGVFGWSCDLPGSQPPHLEQGSFVLTLLGSWESRLKRLCVCVNASGHAGKLRSFCSPCSDTEISWGASLSLGPASSQVLELLWLDGMQWF